MYAINVPPLPCCVLLEVQIPSRNFFVTVVLVDQLLNFLGLVSLHYGLVSILVLVLLVSNNHVDPLLGILVHWFRVKNVLIWQLRSLRVVRVHHGRRGQSAVGVALAERIGAGLRERGDRAHRPRRDPVHGQRLRPRQIVELNRPLPQP